MKHVKRKFNQQIQLKFNAEAVFNGLPQEPLGKGISEIVQKTPDNYLGWVFTDKNEIIKCFQYRAKTDSLMIPEPDPVLIYFNTAQINCRIIETKGSRNALMESLRMFKDMTPIMHNLYEFFSHSSSFAVFCFMAVETLVNKVIPDGHSIRNVMKNRTEEYNIQQIQQMEFMKKVKEVLPELTNKSFWKDRPDQYQLLHDLKVFRDEVVHTKKQVDDATYYQRLFITALNFEYVKTLEAVRDFINYYEPNLVEECTCGADF